MLQHFGVIPYLVFDGDYLPSKAATEADRSKRREDSKKAGFELMNAGKPSQAYLEFQKAIDVTPEMARQLIDELKANKVQYIVAPYEADAQMVYLERKGIIHGILSEDSDLLVFGAKCLLTKLDQYGNCIEINKADFCACKEITLTGWSDKEFRQMAILSGCDYLASISNMGLKTAYRMMRKHRTVEKVLRMLQFDGKFHVPKGYQEAFYKAELTFLHQRVFCPTAQALVLHTQPDQPLDESKMEFIGAYVEPQIALGVSTGHLNPMTKLPIVLEGALVKPKSTMVKSTPVTSRTRHQLSLSSISAGNVKKDKGKDKPIHAFFPKRIPLGELDPNSVTLPPNMRDAFLQNYGTLSVAPLARVYLNRPTPSPVPQSAPARLPNSQRLSVYTPTPQETRPQKRTRLCADIESGGSPSKKVDLSRSRFFASQASPTLGRSSKEKIARARKANVNIFSDDSIEEAMLGLPDTDGFKSDVTAAKKFDIFQGENSISEKQPSITAGGYSQSQGSVPGLTASDSFTSSAEAPSTPSDIDTPVQTIKENFAFTSTPQYTPKSTTSVRSAAALSSSPRTSKIPLAVKPTINKRPTPLQRIGASAANRSKLFPMTPPETPLYTIKNNNPRRSSLLAKGSVPFPEVVGAAKPATPSPKLDKSETNTPVQQNGSEDMIIHDSSEEEEEPLSPIHGGINENLPTAHLNLKRFVYNN